MKKKGDFPPVITLCLSDGCFRIRLNLSENFTCIQNASGSFSDIFQTDQNSNKPCSGSTSHLTRLRSRPRSSLLITNEPASANRFLRRLPARPHLCHLLSPLPPSCSFPSLLVFLPCLDTLQPLLWQGAWDSPFAEWAAGSGGGKEGEIE